jgi:hypothetical protein
MPNDPLSSPHASGEPRREADGESRQSGTTARARSRSFVTEYSSRDRQNDAQQAPGAIARFEAALRDDAALQIPAALARILDDLVAAMGQIETALAETARPAPDAHFALERIQDVAMALRQREVEAALCDGLDDAVREVGDAMLRNDAAAADVGNAAALLRQLARRVSDLIAHGSLAEAESARDPIADRAAAQSGAERLDITGHRAVADVPAPMSEQGDFRSLPEFESNLPEAVPETQANVGLQENPRLRFEPLPLPIPSPIEGSGQESQAGAGTSSLASAAAIQVPLPASNDPLAALQSLSEEELIALFS